MDREVWLKSERRMALRMYDKGDYGIWTSINIYLTVNIRVTSHWYNMESEPNGQVRQQEG